MEARSDEIIQIDRELKEQDKIDEGTRYFAVEKPFILSLEDVERIRKAIQSPSQASRVKAWLELPAPFFGLEVHSQVQGHLGWLKDA